MCARASARAALLFISVFLMIHELLELLATKTSPRARLLVPGTCDMHLRMHFFVHNKETGKKHTTLMEMLDKCVESCLTAQASPAQLCKIYLILNSFIFFFSTVF